jgi:hypothetical protein
MVDETLSVGGSAASVCPWCSAPVAGAPQICPSCGAALDGELADPSLPGVTAIDAAAIVRAKMPTPRSRSRLLSWISGDYPEEANAGGGDTAALAPPDLEVRREILRLELEAEVANLQAEADALRAEATVEGRAPDASAEDAAAADQVVAEVDAIEAELEKVDVALDTDPLVPTTVDADVAPDVDGATPEDAVGVTAEAAADAAPSPATPDEDATRA